MIKRILFAAAFAAVLASKSYAHEGHNDTSALTGSAPASNAPLSLSAEGISNLGIQTRGAGMKALPETLTMPAAVTPIPEKQAQITTRFDGRVQEIKVKVGQDVRQGQDLIVIEPVQLGTKVITYQAPMAGRIMRQNVVLGQSATFQTSLIEIADLSKILLKGAIYETPDLARVTVGQRVRAAIGIYPKRIFEGVVEKIDAGPGADSRVMHVYAIFDNADGALKPNLRGTMTVALTSGEKPSVTVPASSVLENNGVSFVFVREGNKFERREVRTGRKSGEEMEIVSGILPDEEVVTQGNYQLQYLKAETPKEEGKH